MIDTPKYHLKNLPIISKMQSDSIFFARQCIPGHNHAHNGYCYENKFYDKLNVHSI